MVQVSNRIDLVFVHLNSNIPLYLRLNLRSVVRKFPNHNVVLIHNVAQISRIPRGVVQFNYKGSPNLMKIDSNLKHPKEFRNNFWLTSIGRFDALSAYMETTNRSLIHVESDVILSDDFPIDKFNEISSMLAFPVVAGNRGVASTLYIKNLESAQKLVNQSVEISDINPNTSDMEILAKFNSEFKQECLILPFAPSDNQYFHEPIGAEAKLDSLSQIKRFGGIFDGNDIGVYLFGSDPRNRRGISYIRQEIQGNYAATSKWKFRYDKKRKFLAVINGEEEIAVYSAHATSKSIWIFWHVTRTLRLRISLFRNTGKPSARFHLFTFLRAIVKKLARQLFKK